MPTLLHRRARVARTAAAWAFAAAVALAVAGCPAKKPAVEDPGDVVAGGTGGGGGAAEAAAARAFEKGVKAFDAGRYDEALASFKEAEKSTPDDPQVLLNVALCEVALGHADKAAPPLEHAVAKKPEFFEGWNELGAVYLDLDKPAEARAALEKALALKPGDTSARFNLGMAYRRGGDLTGAERELSAVLAANPTDVDAHLELGLVKAKAGEGPAAVKLFEKAVALAPKNPEAHYLLAGAKKAAGDVDGAAAAYRAAYAADPKMRDAYTALADLYAGKDRWGDAAAALADAVKAFPADGAVRASYGNALRKAGDNAGAVEAYKKALELDPRDVIADRGLALVAVAVGKCDEAHARFEAAVEKYRADADAHAALEKARDVIDGCGKAAPTAGGAKTPAAPATHGPTKSSAPKPKGKSK